MSAVVPIRPLRVLFVDDEARITRALRALFRDLEVFVTNDPAEAPRIATEKDVDVVVCDQRMPGLTGVDCLREIRQLAPRAMRILLTGFSDLKAVLGSVNEGEVFRFVSKPWDNRELREIVTTAGRIARETPAIGADVLSQRDHDEARGQVGVPFDPNAVLPRYPAPRAPAQIALVAAEFGLKLSPVPTGVTPVAALGWIGWRAADAAEAPTTEQQSPDSTGHRSTTVTPVLIERDASGRTQIHAPRPSEALARAARGEAKLDLIESWVIQRDTSHGHAAPEASDMADDPATDAETRRRPFGFPAIWREVMRYPGIWRQVLLASLAIQVVGLGTPLLTQVIIDKVLVHHTMSTLIVVAAALVVFMLFTSGMTWIRQYLILHTGSRIDAVLGDSVFGHLLRLPVPWFEKRPTGTVIARLQGIETIREFLTGATVSLVLDIPFLCVFIAIMFVYSWQLSLIAVAITGMIALLSLLVTPLLRRRLDQQFLAGARAQAFTTEYVSGYETVKALQLEPTLQRRYGGLLADHLATTFSTRQLGNTFGTLAGALEQVMTLAILVVGALLVMRNDGFTVGMLVAFQMFASRMSQPMMRIVGLWQEFQQASIAVKRLGDLMNAPAEPHAQRAVRTQAAGPAELRIENVSFRYGDDQPWTLKHFDLTLERGKLTVLTGPSGSGKSTLTKLLLGYRRPDEGRIRIVSDNPTPSFPARASRGECCQVRRAERDDGEGRQGSAGRGAVAGAGGAAVGGSGVGGAVLRARADRIGEFLPVAFAAGLRCGSGGAGSVGAGGTRLR